MHRLLVAFVLLLQLPLGLRASGENYIELTTEAIAAYAEIDLDSLQERLGGKRTVLYIGSTKAHHVIFVDATSREGGMPWTFFEKFRVPQKILHVEEARKLSFEDGPVGIAPFSEGRRIFSLDRRPRLVMPAKKSP